MYPGTCLYDMFLCFYILWAFSALCIFVFASEVVSRPTFWFLLWILLMPLGGSILSCIWVVLQLSIWCFFGKYCVFVFPHRCSRSFSWRYYLVDLSLFILCLFLSIFFISFYPFFVPLFCWLVFRGVCVVYFPCWVTIVVMSSSFVYI